MSILLASTLVLTYNGLDGCILHALDARIFIVAYGMQVMEQWLAHSLDL